MICLLMKFLLHLRWNRRNGYLDTRRNGELETCLLGEMETSGHGELEKRTNGYSEKWTLVHLETRILGETEKSGHGETDTWRIGDITGGTRYMFNKNRNIYDLRRRAGIEFPQSTWT